MAYWSRERAAAVISDEYFKISPRQLMRWSSVPIVYLNGRAHGLDADWRTAAEAKLQAMLQQQGDQRAPLLKLAKLGNAATARKRAAAKAVGA
jgi:hypothetical protein